MGSEGLFVLAVFTINANQAKLVGAYWPRNELVITEEGYLYTRSSGGADFTNYKISQITNEDTGISVIIEFGVEGRSYYEIIHGKKQDIDQQRFEELIHMYPFEEGARWKSAIIREIPV